MITTTIPTLAAVTADQYRTFALASAATSAANAFDFLLKEKIMAKLKTLGFVFDSDATFLTFAAARLSIIPIAASDIKMVCLDAVVTGEAVTSIGTKIVEYTGTGYSVRTPDPNYSLSTIV